MYMIYFFLDALHSLSQFRLPSTLVLLQHSSLLSHKVLRIPHVQLLSDWYTVTFVARYSSVHISRQPYFQQLYSLVGEFRLDIDDPNMIQYALSKCSWYRRNRGRFRPRVGFHWCQKSPYKCVHGDSCIYLRKHVNGELRRM